MNFEKERKLLAEKIVKKFVLGSESGFKVVDVIYRDPTTENCACGYKYYCFVTFRHGENLEKISKCDMWFYCSDRPEELCLISICGETIGESIGDTISIPIPTISTELLEKQPKKKADLPSKRSV